MLGIEDPVAFLESLPALGILVTVFLAATLEYVFPPIWGDLAVLLGFFLAGRGAVAPEGVLAVAFVGSVAGAMIAFELGRRTGPAIVLRFAPRGTTEEDLEKLRRTIRRFGEPVLLANRFLPVLRAVLLYAAGAMGLRFVRAMCWSAAGSILFLWLLMQVALWTAGSWDQIVAVFEQFYRIAAGLAVVAVGVWVAYRIRRAHRPQ